MDGRFLPVHFWFVAPSSLQIVQLSCHSLLHNKVYLYPCYNLSLSAMQDLPEASMEASH